MSGKMSGRRLFFMVEKLVLGSCNLCSVQGFVSAPQGCGRCIFNDADVELLGSTPGGQWGISDPLLSKFWFQMFGTREAVSWPEFWSKFRLHIDDRQDYVGGVLARWCPTLLQEQWPNLCMRDSYPVGMHRFRYCTSKTNIETCEFGFSPYRKESIRNQETFTATQCNHINLDWSMQR